MNHDEHRMTRRGALAAGLAGATVAAMLAQQDSGAEATPDATGPRPAAPSGRMPVVYVPHGGGPWPFVDLGFGDKTELDALATYLRSVGALPKTPPKALLVVSAHWEELVPTVMTSPRPPLLFDYYGFPPAAYALTWPAPGDPALAARVQELLKTAGIASATDAERGFDHGTFVPLKLTYPKADVPTIQLSLKRGLDPVEHLAIGRAIAPLRDEGVLILGSGMSYHNMRGFGPQGLPASEAFDAWLGEAVALDAEPRARRLAQWSSAPSARQVHPREEHLLPLMVIAGAAGSDRGRTAFNQKAMGVRLSGYHFG